MLGIDSDLRDETPRSPFQAALGEMSKLAAATSFEKRGRRTKSRSILNTMQLFQATTIWYLIAITIIVFQQQKIWVKSYLGHCDILDITDKLQNITIIVPVRP